MSTHRRTWQRSEARAAASIGARRKPGSGSSGRSDETRSDSTSETIFLECKHYARHAAVTLWDSTWTLAKRERKTPLVCLSVKGRPGRWWLLHHRDVPALVAEWLSQQDAGAVDDVMRRVWRIKGL